MFSDIGVDRRQRITILAEAGSLDREQGTPRGMNTPTDPIGVTPVRLPGGGSTTLMRVMQTNACSLSCGYCPAYRGGNVRRTSLAPEEIATTFVEAHRGGLAQGLFLTSGVPGRPRRAMDRMLATLEIVRRRGFHGYIHVKLLPGIERAQVEAAAALANRVSVNLEAPTDAYVRRLAREKDLSGDLLPTLELAGRLSLEARLDPRPDGPRTAGTTTQFVVGAAGERDHEILRLVARLEERRLLHHAHFSSFQPVVGTPMEGAAATVPVRELRLYQAEHLLRRYGFRYDELAFEPDGNLALDRDPKTTWAVRHPEVFPVEITSAPYELLLRVPGVGPRAARALVAVRRTVVVREVRDLRRLGVDTVRAACFLALRGRRLAGRPSPEQLRLFPPGGHLTQAPYRTSVPPCAYR
jgi:predicted DNA-binding helix-hairpin-helix protein